MSSEEKKFPTKFSGYYVSEEGRVYTEWDRFGKRGNLREVKSNSRGSGYRGVNISLKDETGKTKKQIKYYVHRLVGETLLDNPHNLPEIDHINRDKRDNTLSNLRWVNRRENQRWMNIKFTITDNLTNKVYNTDCIQDFVEDNWSWISKRTRTSRKDYVWKHLRDSRKGYNLTLTENNE